MKKESQNKAILNHLMKGNGITSMLAFKTFGCTRLSARLFELREAGYPIIYQWAEHGGKRFKIYRLSEEYLESIKHKPVVVDLDLFTVIAEGNLSPIPLTEEWLERFGAKIPTKDDRLEKHYHFHLGGISIYVCVDHGNRFANEGKALILIDGMPVHSVECRYVHQLQNLYFALTGKELTEKTIKKP